MKYQLITMFLAPEYEESLEKFNTDLVCYVISKADNKVANVGVVTRRALNDWYDDRRTKFDETKFYFVVATISIAGVLKGAEVKECSAEQLKDNKGKPVVN